MTEEHPKRPTPDSAHWPREGADAGATRELSSLGEPIVNRRITEGIVDRLVTAVALGLYVPGQQLPTERDLSGMLKVSRSSLREALQQLTASGYLEVRRGRNGGYFVLADWGPTSAEHVRRQLVSRWSEFQEVFDARTLIEPMIARVATTRRSENDLAAMRDALQAYIDAPDHDASRQADARLHMAIAKSTNNPILVDISADLRTRISLNLGAEPYTDDVRKIAIIQHRQLVDAVACGDAETASAVAAEHFALSETLYRGLVERANREQDTERAP